MATRYTSYTPVVSQFRLDGGAMFGSVPRVLWSRLQAPDEQNRIELVARLLLLRGEGKVVLVDAGMGDKLGPREAEMFGVRNVAPDAVGFRWDEVTDIILTHLHFDHAGGATVRNAAGELGLRAPRARIHLQEENWQLAQAPGPRERASYLRENVEPLRAARLELVRGEAEVLPGIRVFPSRGHTRGLQWVLVGEGRQAVAFPADLIPTASHLHLPYVMGYDMCVETLLAEKESFLRRAAEEGWTVVFAHDPLVPASRVACGPGGRYVLAP